VCDRDTGTVCEWFDIKTTRTVSLGLSSKSVVTISPDLTSKSVATVSLGLASKPVAQVYRFGPQNRQLRFDDLCLKITATVS
jgi:hypothetical protein